MSNGTTVYSKTAKGLQEVSGKTRNVSRYSRGLLRLIDGKASVTELQQKDGNPAEMLQALKALVAEGYIREVVTTTFDFQSDGRADLDFTAAPPAPSPTPAPAPAQAPAPRDGAERAKREAAEHAQQEAEEQVKKLAKEVVRREAKERAKREAAEEAQRKAEDEARQKVEEAARRADEERARREAAERSQRELEEAARRLAEQAAQREAEERARSEAAEQARRQAEELAQRQAAAAAQREAEERARREAAERARQEAEEYARRLADETARHLAEERARREAAEEAQREAEKAAKRAAEEAAQREAEKAAKRAAEEAARREAAERARQEAEEYARRLADETARNLAEERAKREAAEEAQREAEMAAKRAAEEAAQREAEKAAKRAAEEAARREAAERARQEAEEYARRLADETARNLAEERAKREAAEEAQREAEKAAKRAADEAARREADDQARREAEKRVWQQAEEAAQRTLRDAEKRAKLQAEEATREYAAQKQRDADERARQKAKEEADRVAEKRARHAEAQEASRRAAEQRAAAKERTASAQPVVRRSRSPLQKLAVGALTVVVAAGLAAVHLVPFNGRIPALEAAITARLQQPAKINSLHFALLPRPHWRLEDVSIGAAKQIRAPRVDAFMTAAALFSDPSAISAIEVDAPTLDAEGLGWLLFGAARAGDSGLRRVDAREARLEGLGAKVPALNVNAEPGDGGQWQKLTATAAEKGLTLELRRNGDAMDVHVNAASFAAPVAGLPELRDFTARGTLMRDRLTLAEFQGDAFGGTLKGSARLVWHGAARLDGELQAQRVEVAQVLPRVFAGGQLEGKAAFSLPLLAESPAAASQLSGDFVVRKGTLATVDLGRILLGDSAGRTSFSTLEGNLAYDRGRMQLRQLRLAAGAVTAQGSVDVAADNSLRGTVAIDLNLGTQRRRGDFEVSGLATESLAWKRR